MSTVVVLAGGPDPPVGVSVPAGATVIAADGGADLARALGLHVDLAVGDFDSIAVEAVDAARIERHPTDKEATDLELALAAALRHEPDAVLVLAGAGGRLDHLLGGLLLLAADPYADVQVDARFGTAAVHVVHGARRLHGEPGELVSLFAVHGPATGVVTEGLAYALRGETLEPGSTRGVSNVFAAAEACIALASGVLLAVRPTCSAPAGS
jgi:thiamine pyrophosphokinase